MDGGTRTKWDRWSKKKMRKLWHATNIRRELIQDKKKKKTLIKNKNIFDRMQ